MTKHSPGPWTSCKALGGNCKCGLVWDATGEWAAKVERADAESGGSISDEAFFANRTLIESAPELLDLLAYHHSLACLDCDKDKHMQRESTCPTAAILKVNGR